jgi:glycosyltransferase involved in cell wall biosynthesis/GT2 family glycosyltransferase
VSLDVVVVTYNSSALLPDALAGLPDSARVVVVDNASTDDSVEVTRALGVDVVEGAVNAGFAAAANRGAAFGDGELVLFLNPDAVVDAGLIERLCARFDADPGLGVLSPRLRRPDGSEQRVRWPFPSAPGAWREALGLHRLRSRPAGDGFVIGACFMVRRSVLEAVGGFDTRFWLYSEEADLCRRVRDAGWRVEVAEDLVARHVGGASGEGAEGLVFEHFERGGEHFVAKHEGKGSLLAYRLANLKGAGLRALLPGSPPRRSLQRARVRRLLGVLGRHAGTVRLDSPATAAPCVGLVVCSLEPWDDVWRRNQFFVRELLALHPDRRVLFVEPPFDWVHEVRRRCGRVRRRGLRPLDADGRVVRLEPGKVWPGVLGGLADRSRRRQVRAAAAELGFVAPTLWVNDPAYAGLAAEARWPAVYDITDDWTEAGDGARATRRVRARERRLFAECERVVVCSPGLADSRSALPAADDPVLIPNAVDTSLFGAPQARPVDLPPGPVAVYVGTLHEDRLDVDLVVELAQRRSDLAVALVGPDALSATSRARLVGAGVRVIGARPHAQVPGYLQHADVVVVPHVVSAFTESLDPIKAYECLAVGRPTVATPVAGFRELGDPVQVVDRAGFVDAVGTVVDGGWRASAPRPVPTWTERAAAFDEVLASARRARRRPLSVVYVDHCALLSGGELALARLLPAIEGVDAHVILGEHGPLEAMLRDAGATVEVLALDTGVATTHRHEVTASSLGVRRVVATGRDTWVLARRLRQLKPDLVHTNSLKAALYGGVAGRLAGVPVVWHIRDRIAADYLPAGARKVVRALAHVLPTVVIANSEATRATLGRAVRAGVVPSPVLYDSVAVLVDSLDDRPRPFEVAMVGRLAPWKGQDVFLDAFAQAFGGGSERALVVGSAMFGDDEYAATLPGLAAELGLADRVEFTGFVHDVASVLGRVDVLVHASVIPEPFGQVVIEGMAAGLTVIASNEGGPAEVIRDGVDGLLYPAGDAHALAAVLRRVAGDEELRARLGSAARVRAADFSPQHVGAQVRAIYDQALSG